MRFAIKRKFVRDYFLMGFFLTFFSSNLVGQQPTNTAMNLDKILNDGATVRAFVDSELINYNVSINEKIETNHPLLLYNFNKIQPEKKVYTIFNLPVDKVLAYKKDSEQFCLFLLMEFNKDSLNVFAERLGYAHNVTTDDYKAGDFDFLAWHWKDMEAFILPDRVSMGKYPGTNRVIVQVTNMDLKEVLSSEKIFLTE
ncbi:MAG TPA: hypothetical protein VM802_17685 [Chitinophaga sp.]|uniref:hypothetical protein n=1 Tax=Chitinophaga sp. TaxID=1869181 RepID=UPI002CA2C5DD|nr:hypothetical protein [Chitinophaga sp.]HVI46715.1 hypothetical protein [Chitinophaga sp.]